MRLPTPPPSCGLLFYLLLPQKAVARALARSLVSSKKSAQACEGGRQPVRGGRVGLSVVSLWSALKKESTLFFTPQQGRAQLKYPFGKLKGLPLRSSTNQGGNPTTASDRAASIDLRDRWQLTAR